MQKAIVTTTINKPTKAILEFIKKTDWKLFIVGDLKTPHKEYEKLVNDRINYFHPDYQSSKYKKLSDLIGWNCIQRRSIGLIEAYKWGADIIATVDDDNIPYKGWGENLLLGKSVKVNYYKTSLPAFDPLGLTNHGNLWHRGYPLELISKRDYSSITQKIIKADIQADLWDGDPDIDAVCRMIYAPNCKFKEKYFPYSSNKISPFNSQNTFLTRSVIKDYFLFPHVGRMDDIWASFFVQAKGFKAVYSKPTVFQERNVHNLTKDMKAEYLGYENNFKIVNEIFQDPENLYKYLPEETLKSFKAYQKYF
jgi:hypothetical protein